MREFSTNDLQRDLTSVTIAAAREPVAITRHRKKQFVLMAVEDYERLICRREDPRRVYGEGETPPELADFLVAGLQAKSRELSGEETE